MRRTLAWRGLDAPRMEIAHVEVDGTELRARGTQIGVEPAPYELRYEVAPGRLRAEVVGGASLDLKLDADFFDLGYSPLFNSLPILRYELHRGGDARDFVMAWVSVPDLAVLRSEQRYEPLRPGLVRFRGSHRPETPGFDLEVDEEGFVVRYPRLAELIRVSG
jgi:hypothetical protein